MKDIRLNEGYNEQLNEINCPQDSYTTLSDPDYNRQVDIDKTFDYLNNINWNKEQDYHNTYYKGNGQYGSRTIRMNNKKYHEINK